MTSKFAIAGVLVAAGACLGAEAASAQATVTASIQRQAAPPSQRSGRSLPPAVLWLSPVGSRAVPAHQEDRSPYTLLQKNRMFMPHVLVVPLGAAVSFPNADPFFHNVFSLYNGKRFDLGLYEKGSNRQVLFNQQGVSYIFCNIHPEMSAVVLALDTPWWAHADVGGILRIDNLLPGDYEAHLWVEGVETGQLEGWTHRVHVTRGANDVGRFTVGSDVLPMKHMNKFGAAYLPETQSY